MNLRPRDRIALAVVLLVAIIGGYYMLALKPEQNKAGSLQASITAEQQKLTQAQQSYAQGRAAAASLTADDAQWNSLRLAVPVQSDIPGLLRVLQKTADQAHVDMQSISLTGPTGSSTPTPTATPATGGTAAPAGAAATGVPIALTFAGGYAALNTLVRRLNALVRVSGGKVTASGPLLSISDVTLGGAPKLTVQLSATIYQLGSPSPAAATTGG
jgi:Type II secretion system (T2SS), protein M